MSRPRSNDRFLVKEAFEAVMRLYWRTPSIEPRTAILPAGLELTVLSDPTLVAREAIVRPTEAERNEAAFVAEADRTHPMYGGYAFQVPFADLRTKCEPLPPA